MTAVWKDGGRGVGWDSSVQVEPHEHPASQGVVHTHRKVSSRDCCVHSSESMSLSEPWSSSTGASKHKSPNR